MWCGYPAARSFGNESAAHPHESHQAGLQLLQAPTST